MASQEMPGLGYFYHKLAQNPRKGDRSAESGIPTDGKYRKQYLRQALAFFLHATKLPPLGNMEGYGKSDCPYSLFTGLAGAVTAWSEACAILHNRLGEEHSDAAKTIDTKPTEVLGMPWLGGLGCCGI